MDVSMRMRDYREEVDLPRHRQTPRPQLGWLCVSCSRVWAQGPVEYASKSSATRQSRQGPLTLKCAPVPTFFAVLSICKVALVLYVIEKTREK
jgi:hypothetical protein